RPLPHSGGTVTGVRRRVAALSTHASDPASHRRRRARDDEADGVSDQHHPRGRRRRGRARRRPRQRGDRRSGSRRLREGTGGPPDPARTRQRRPHPSSGIGHPGDPHRHGHARRPQRGGRPARRRPVDTGGALAMRVVVAPDKFKGSLTAVEAAEARAAGVHDVLPDAHVDRCPVADGGEGTLDVLLPVGGRRVDVRVCGPLSDPVEAYYVVLDDWAYVESARACGIEHVTPTRHTALRSHTYGVGELLRHAIDNGARGVVLTVGGTASTDGGAGMLQALGATILDADGAAVDRGGEALNSVATVDLTEVRRVLDGVAVRVATDVTNPLLGPHGAAPVFGPQKGAGPEEIRTLESGLRTWAQALIRAGVRDIAPLPGAGAGGGVAGALAALGATVESGFDLIAAVTGVDRAIPGADLALTGEG